MTTRENNEYTVYVDTDRRIFIDDILGGFILEDSLIFIL